MSRDYPSPNYKHPLKGVTDVNMVKYWLEHNMLSRSFKSIEYEPPTRESYYGLDQYAETVDILFLFAGSQEFRKFTPQVCNTITFGQMMQLYPIYASCFSFALTSFQYTLPNGDIYYSIIEILKNISEDDVHLYIEKYNNRYPGISILLSTLPYQTSLHLVQTIMSNKQSVSLGLYQDYLICSTVFNTFNPDICRLFNNQLEKGAFYTYAGMYSPSAVEYMIGGDIRFRQYGLDTQKELIDKIFLFPSKSIDIIHSSNKCNDNLLPILRAYIASNEIHKVKSLLGYNTTPTVPIIGNSNVLRFAKSAEMVHLLVSCKASVDDTEDPPIYSAIEKSSLDVVKALLYYKASLDCDESGGHLLHYIGSCSPDIVEFFIPFLSSSTSDIAIHVKNNNTTGLPDDVYHHIKSSLSKIDINISDTYGDLSKTPLTQSLISGIHVPYLLDNKASPHLYKHITGQTWVTCNTYDDALDLINNNRELMTPEYLHYTDSILMFFKLKTPVYNQSYHLTYHFMKYKAYPLTYLPLRSPTTGKMIISSHLMSAINHKHLDFVQLLLQYLTPLNIPFKPYQNGLIDTKNAYPLEYAGSAKSPFRDVLYELIQYGAIYDPKSTLIKLHDNIYSLVMDQCF